MVIEFTEEEIAHARRMIRYFALEWYSEIPTKIHQARAFDEGGAPEYTSDFYSYIDDAMKSKGREERPRRVHDIDNPKRKVTQAFRTLRKRAPREWDAMRCLVVIDQVGRHASPRDEEKLEEQFESSLRATAIRFNERAERLNKEERYSRDEVLLLVISAVEKLSRWAS